MLRWLALSFLALFLLSGCSVALFEVKYVPPPKTPRQTPKEQINIPSLTETSRQQARDGKKGFITNVQIDSGFASAVGLSADNCIQVTTLENGDEIVDFGNVACPPTPSSTELLPADNIAFTLFYEEVAGAGPYPEYDLVLDEDALGHAKAISMTTVEMYDLCTGTYAVKCDLIISGNRFSDFKLK